MNASLLIRDLLEGLIVLSIGAMTWAAIGKLRRHEVAVVRCVNCGRTTSRAYATCPRCKA